MFKLLKVVFVLGLISSALAQATLAEQKAVNYVLKLLEGTSDVCPASLKLPFAYCGSYNASRTEAIQVIDNLVFVQDWESVKDWTLDGSDSGFTTFRYADSQSEIWNADVYLVENYLVFSFYANYLNAE